MSKELKFLNEVFDYITGESKEFNSVQIIDKIIDIKLALYRLEKLETPPTADEVCKALSEWLDKEIGYNLGTKEFIYRIEEDLFEYITETYGDGLWTLSHYLPPHLITLIGRFYEVQDV